MLTFRKGGYSREDIQLLHDVLKTGIDSSTKNCDGLCLNCNYQKVCTDIHLVLAYIEKLLKPET